MKTAAVTPSAHVAAYSSCRRQAPPREFFTPPQMLQLISANAVARQTQTLASFSARGTEAENSFALTQAVGSRQQQYKWHQRRTSQTRKIYVSDG